MDLPPDENKIRGELASPNLPPEEIDSSITQGHIFDVNMVQRGRCYDCDDCYQFWAQDQANRTIKTIKDVPCLSCGHAPGRHARVIKRGACLNCADCYKFRANPWDPGDFRFKEWTEGAEPTRKCGRCGCFIEQHAPTEIPPKVLDEIHSTVDHAPSIAGARGAKERVPDAQPTGRARPLKTYKLEVLTGNRPDAETSANVTVTIMGSDNLRSRVDLDKQLTKVGIGSQRFSPP